MWLSFIIPLYNCGKYIATCLDSLYQQGLEEQEFEVVVINDGSTDQGPQIVERYCQEHRNIRLLNQKNEGVSSARNRGISEAKGDYIHFIDADDRLLPHGMKIIKDSYLEKYHHPDMIKFWAHTVDRYYSPQEWECIRDHKVLFKGCFQEYGNRYGFGWNVCSQIISRSLITDNHLSFKPYPIGEDVMFMMDLFTLTQATILATNLNIYRYCVRGDSALNKSDRAHIERTIYGFMDLFLKIKEIETHSPYDKGIYEKEIRIFQQKAFIRLVSARFSYSSVRELLNKCKESGFYPVERATTRLHKLINLSTKYSWIAYGLSIPIRYVFIPFIKPYIKRN